jgi:hypothetical protein
MIKRKDNDGWLASIRAETQRLRRKYSDWGLTLLTIFLLLLCFVFSPLQALGSYAFQVLSIIGLLAIVIIVMIISTNRFALVIMTVAFLANLVVVVSRSFDPPWSYSLHLLALAWLVFATAQGLVVFEVVFRRGSITYHRIIGAILLYLLIAIVFVSLFALLGLSVPNAFKGVSFENRATLASELIYLSFVTLTTTGYGDIVPIHPLARSLCNLEAIVGQLYPATLLARIVTLELQR